MNLKKWIIRRVRAQFGRPTGFPGRVVGWIMGRTLIESPAERLGRVAA